MSTPHPRFIAFLVLFALTILSAVQFLQIEESVILGFDLAAMVFIATCLPLWRGDDHKRPLGGDIRPESDPAGRHE